MLVLMAVAAACMSRSTHAGSSPLPQTPVAATSRLAATGPLAIDLPLTSLLSPTADAEGTPAATAASFRLAVPFRTQKDGDRFQGSNCGPAALGMVLEAFGITHTNSELRLLTHTYQGTVGARTGTALQHMARVGRDFGLNPIGLYGGQEFARWTIEDIRAELRAGRPVIPLVKYRLLPGHEDSRFRADHYIVIHGMDGDEFLYHDPAFESPWEGAARWIDASRLDEAMRPTFPRQQAVAFDPGRHAALPVLGV